jgi:hypothetical protein
LNNSQKGRNNQTAYAGETSTADLLNHSGSSSSRQTNNNGSSNVDKSIEEALYHIEQLKEDMNHLCSDLDHLYTKKILNPGATTTSTTLASIDTSSLSKSTLNLLNELNITTASANSSPTPSRKSANRPGSGCRSSRGKHFLVEANNSTNKDFYNICSSYFDSIYSVHASNGSEGSAFNDCSTQTMVQQSMSSLRSSSTFCAREDDQAESRAESRLQKRVRAAHRNHHYKHNAKCQHHYKQQRSKKGNYRRLVRKVLNKRAD